MTFGKPLLLGLLASTAQAPLQAQTEPAPAPPSATGVSTAGPASNAEAPASAEAQPAAPAEEEEELGEEDGEEIVVTGRRQRGAVIGDIPPEIQLNARDVRALGAGSIAEVLEALAPQTQSGRGRGGGRPVMLLNGRRISGFQEIRNIPPEAIQRIDILPEEVALKYGYRADQRVVNFVLRRRFRALTSELEYGLATDGGRSNYEADVNLLRIDRAGRWELDVEYEHSAALFESERDIDAPLGDFRTLLPESDRLELGGTLNRTILGNVSATGNATFTANESQSRFGLAPGSATRPLTRESESRDGHLGISLNGDIQPWRWSLTGNYDRTHNVTRTDRRDVLDLRDRAETNGQVANAELVLNGSLFRMPGGDVSTTFRTGIERQDLESVSTRSGVEAGGDLGRTRGNAQVNLDIPIASGRNDVLAILGNLSANLNAEFEHYSDFGTLRTWGGGLNWSPITELSLIASVTDEEGAPSMQQLGNPVLATPNVRVFDFTRGETVDATRIEGGNPALLADNRRVFKLGLNARPLSETDLSLTANYTNTRTRDAISSFPAITAEIEAAFPERFERDASGRLFRFDSRSVNFERTDREELRWGINFSKPIASAPPPPGAFPQRFRQGRGQGGGQGGGAGNAGSRTGAPREAAPAAGAAPATPAAGGAAGGAPETEGQRAQAGQGGAAGGFRGGFGGPGGGFGRGGGRFGGGRGGRVQFGLFHTWRLQDTILIREGVPELDLLNGSAFGSRGGRPRHEIEAQAGIFKNGFGARVTANWQSGTQVTGLATGAGGERSDLFFSDIATVNLRLFANLGEQAFVTRNPWLRGTRVALSVNNLFNTRPNVTDASGVTPLGYRPDELDPLGRSISLSIRKLLF